MGEGAGSLRILVINLCFAQKIEKIKKYGAEIAVFLWKNITKMLNYR